MWPRPVETAHRMHILWAPFDRTRSLKIVVINVRGLLSIVQASWRNVCKMMLGTRGPVQVHERIPDSPANLSIGGKSPTLAVISSNFFCWHALGLFDRQVRETEVMGDLTRRKILRQRFEAQKQTL